MNLILIAGLPATGKSRFASYLQQRLNIPLLCKDSIKEILFDTIGFQSHDEKTKLNHAALESLYYAARQILAAGSSGRSPFILQNGPAAGSLPSALSGSCRSRRRSWRSSRNPAHSRRTGC